MEPAMTSAISATSIRNDRRAFTLVELLVVIGIIVLIASIGIPMGMKAYRAGDRARAQADLNSIAVALEQFKADWGDYPRPESQGANCGFAALGRYLIGPGPAAAASTPKFNASRTTPYGIGDVASDGATPPKEYVWVDPDTAPTSSPPTAGWMLVSYADGHDGPGMKKPIGGRTYGPYLQADKFKMRGLAILDRQGNPILYFPALAAKPNIHSANGFAMSYDPALPNSPRPLYNIGDNEMPFRVPTETDNVKSLRTLQIVLGDTNCDNMIGTGETEVTTAPFLLWSAGPDGVFGPVRAAGTDPTTDQIRTCDDVTNFK